MENGGENETVLNRKTFFRSEEHLGSELKAELRAPPQPLCCSLSYKEKREKRTSLRNQNKKKTPERNTLRRQKGNTLTEKTRRAGGNK